jgi:cytochrome c biogenesis protein CcmG, thiol:disulfide interchange protein DsbE
MPEIISSEQSTEVIADDEVMVVDTLPEFPANRQARRGMTRHPARWIGVTTGLVSAIVIFALAMAPQSTYSEVNSPLFGHQAPAVSGTEITGATFDLASLRGHFVVVDFFASWCVPCRTEQPQLVTFAEQQHNGALLVGVIFEDTVSEARSLLGPWVGLYPVLADPSGSIALDYGVFNPPSKYVIDPQGRVVVKLIGAVTAAELDSIIARAKRQGL